MTKIKYTILLIDDTFLMLLHIGEKPHEYEIGLNVSSESRKYEQSYS